MVYEELEESEDRGTAASLFLFRYGSTEANYYAYTDVNRPVIRDGITYHPTTIGREKIEASGGLDNKTLDIDITSKAEIVRFYQQKQPSQVVALTIYQGHVDDPDSEFVTVWMGRVIAIDQRDPYAKIQAEPVSTSMRRTGLRRHYQYGCPWALYSAECGASQVAATVSATAAGVGRNLIEFADGWQGAKPKSKFVGGYLQWTDEDNGMTHVRTIFQVRVGEGLAGADVIVVNGTTSGLSFGGGVTLFLGCNHQRDDCTDLHENIVNYGGQLWIPHENPVGYVNRYY